MPYGVAFNSNGRRAYIGNSASDNISVIDTSTNMVIDTVNVGDGPTGICLHPDGTRLYVANAGSNDVYVIDTDTDTVVNTIGVGIQPYAMGNFICAWPGQLQFSASNYTVAEDGGSAIITVDRTGGSDGVVSVVYATYDETAKAGSDYTAATGILTLNNGEIRKSFAVPILDNNVYDGDKTINLKLSNPTSGATLGAQTTAELTINDNEAAPIGDGLCL